MKNQPTYSQVNEGLTANPEITFDENNLPSWYTEGSNSDAFGFGYNAYHYTAATTDDFVYNLKKND